MTVNLPKDLEGSVLATVASGRFVSVDEAIREAVRLLLAGAEQKPGVEPNDGSISPELGSIGFMRDAADELDVVVADAMKRRRAETWRDVSFE